MATKMSDSDNAKISEAKKKWAEADAKGDEKGKAEAHAEAEAVRSNYNYSGGDDGSGYISTNSNPGSWISDKTVNAGGYTSEKTTYADDIEKLSNLRKKQAIAQYKTARDNAIVNLDKQKAEIKPTYQNQRNIVSSNSQLGAKNFAEYLANRGLTNSGASVEGEINRQGALQSSLGNIGVSELKAINNIETLKTQANNDYLNNMANAGAQIEADYFAKLLEKNEQDRQEAKEIERQSYYNYADDYQARLNELKALGLENTDEYKYINALRGQKIATNQSALENNALSYLQMGYSNYDISNALGMPLEDATSLAEHYKQLNDNQLKLSNEELTNSQLSNKYLTKQISNYGSGRSGGSGGNTQSNKVSYSTHKSIIDANTEKYDKNTKKGRNAIYDYLENENKNGRLADNDAITLMNYYGLNNDIESNEGIISNITKNIKNFFS